MPRKCSSFLYIFYVCLFSGSLYAGELVTAEDYDYGPFAARDLSLDGAARVRFLGPVWERRDDGKGRRFSAVRPVYAKVSNDSLPRCLQEVVWPLATFKTFRKEMYWRVVTGFGNDFDVNEPSRYRNHIYPFIFQGRAKDGSSYFALFPVGGTVKEMLGRDSISFVLFPLYARTQVNEAVTKDVLWPIISWGGHDEGSRWRVFPLYGEAQHYGHWKRRFVMWPVWTSVDYEKTGDGGFLLFPVTGYSRIADERTYWLIPPLFKWVESEDRRAVNAPWPFFQYERSVETDKLYVWPLYGSKKQGPRDSSFLLWPVFHASKTVLDGRTESRFHALPFVYADKTVEKSVLEGGAVEEDVTARYFKFWPLFSYRREGDASRFRSLELWPLKHTAPVERNFAPFWTLYTRERLGESRDTELLWGLYRNRKGAGGERAFSIFPLYSMRRQSDSDDYSSWNLLAGLFGREVKSGIRKWKVLYFFRFGEKDLTEE